MPLEKPVQSAPVAQESSALQCATTHARRFVLVDFFVALATLFIFYAGVIYGISFWATFYCTGWNEGSMQVTACTFPGIEQWANRGYGLMLYAAFSFGLPYFIPAGYAFAVGAYWWRRIHGWKGRYGSSRIIAGSGVVVSAAALLAFIAPIVCFPFALVAEVRADHVHYEETRKALTTPTAATFVCDGQKSILIDTDGTVLEKDFSGPGISTSLLGSVSADGFVRNSATVGLVDQYAEELRTCKNSDGKSVLELYKELPPATGFYQ
jgi:hypothetical protein